MITKYDTNSTTLAYWLHWRVLLCAIFVLLPMVLASILIWKYERTNVKDEEDDDGGGGGEREKVYLDESWLPCLKGMHPCWLLMYRVMAFGGMLFIMSADVVEHGVGVFYYYTQWTFALITIYFGFACVLSVYGCYRNGNVVCDDRVGIDTERGTYVAPRSDEHGNGCSTPKTLTPQELYCQRQSAGICGYVFYVLFQLNAGAVVLTDSVFWLIIYPFLSAANDKLTIMKIVTHSLNAVFLLGDAILNSVRFPWFRFAYFILYTGTFVIFQWIIHACVERPWPYPFLELAVPSAPLWYLAVALLHIPSYTLFALIIRTKEFFLKRCFPHSHRCKT